MKVRITGGEYTNMFQPQGAVPNFMSDPQHDRHIAQRNLVPFDGMVPAHRAPHWTNFIASQVGEGVNALGLQHGGPPQGVRFYLAMPTAVYEHYIVRGGSHRGFEPVREGVPKPFPDAVILRQTSPGARLEVAPHEGERYLGMSLGIEGDASRLGDIRMVHTSHHGHVAGGLTLRPVSRPLT